MKISTRIWLLLLAKRYPKLQIVGRLPDIRSHVDTNRNYGIQNILLKLKGQPDANAVKESLLSTILRSVNNEDAAQKWLFPKLRQCLAKHHGFYAWDQNTLDSFNIDNHVTLNASPVISCRRVSASNIQKYVSREVTKYLSADIPPWQIQLIPCCVVEVKQSYKFTFIIETAIDLYLSIVESIGNR